MFDFNNLFQGAFETWGIEEWGIIGLGAIVLIFILFLLFKPKKKKTVAYTEVKVAPKASVSETSQSKTDEAPVVAETPNEVPKVEPKAEPKKTPKAAAKPEAPATTETDKVVKYHVSQNKDQKSEFNNQWRVRKQGSQKTIKYFKTQAEAIKFAESLAENNDTSIVIHKRDGSIRKQDYSKKKSSN